VTDGADVPVERSAKRVRAFVAGVAVVDTVRPLLVWEHRYYPAYYLPAADVRMDLLVPTGTTRHSANLGEATYFSVTVGDTTRPDAAWHYGASAVEAIRDHVRFDWDSMDAWFEEDEEVFVHVRSPYTRVDILPSSRRVRIEADGVVLADSTHAHVLFETGLPPRWYVPKTDVRMDLLVESDSLTRCPYKGEAEYWSVSVGDRAIEDAAWSYRTPLRESQTIAGLLAFYTDRVDVFVDGSRIG
jgi:uncharacterized protein (DUF427 family)